MAAYKKDLLELMNAIETFETTGQHGAHVKALYEELWPNLELYETSLRRFLAELDERRK